GRARPARHGSLLEAGGRLRQEGAGAGHRRRPRFAEGPEGGPGHPRHREHGRLRSRGQFPARVTRWVAMDAPIPGIGPWEEILKNPLLWHFNFRGPDVERLVAGRERIYLDRFWNEFSAHPRRFNEGLRQHYAALYAL